jgi:co-chaperonin GroES (HSP10)
MAHYHLQQKGPVVAITMQKEKYNKAFNIQVGKSVAFSENGQQDDEKDYIHIKIVDAVSINRNINYYEIFVNNFI